MIGAAASIVVDVAIVLFQGALELTVVVLIASIRPWLYVFSPTYRSQVREDLRNHGALHKAWYFGWGSLALLASTGIVAALAWFFWPAPADKEPSSTVEKAQRVFDRVRSLKEGR